MRVFEPAVHDAMADADEAMVGELGAQECDQVIERAVVAELDTFAPRLLAEHVLPSAVLRDEARRRVEAFRLSARDQLERIAALRRTART